MNILAVDFGTKNIGLGWCDTGINVVLPYGVIDNKDKIKAKRELVDLIKTEKIQKVVVGLPYTMDGKENENTKKIRVFVEGFEKEIGIKVEFFDERFTSKQADRMEGGASRDEKSAMVLLESYLVKNKK
ncbi:MAG: Holliday junction resolvase RuvX [Candidatus Magasanikbacteria bacterium]|jgi:putative Holliday junction resolvase